MIYSNYMVLQYRTGARASSCRRPWGWLTERLTKQEWSKGTDCERQQAE